MDQLWVQALFWGAVSGGALVVGAAAGFLVKVPRTVVAAVMAFGSGVLISALSFELMEEAVEEAGLASSAVGFLVGAGLYAGANALLAARGAKERKRSGDLQPSEEEQSGSGAAIAVGALLDGIPESIAIGLSILHGGTVSIATVVAIFLSNLPEGLASSDGMRRAGRPAACRNRGPGTRRRPGAGGDGLRHIGALRPCRAHPALRRCLDRSRHRAGGGRRR